MSAFGESAFQRSLQGSQFATDVTPAAEAVTLGRWTAINSLEPGDRAPSRREELPSIAFIARSTLRVTSFRRGRTGGIVGLTCYFISPAG